MAVQRNNNEKLKESGFIEGLMKRSVGKEGMLITRLLKKYGTREGEVVWDSVKAEL